jgi:outer membrane protein
MRSVVIAVVFSAATLASPPTAERLTLAEAEAIALKNHPAIMAEKLEAQATQQRVEQARAARFPFVTANVTAVGAEDDSRIAAGALNNPIIYSRVATGVSINQTLLDSGRTSKLIASAKTSAAASDQRADVTRADVILSVRRAYFNALRAESVLRVAKATVDARQLVVDQVSELVKASLKSSLDQSFAETNLAEAKLLVASADNERQAAYADLAQTLGRQSPEVLELAEGPSPNVEPLALSELREQALRRRPDLKAARLDMEAAREFAAAERALKFPTIAAAVGVGYVPNSGPNLSSDYAAGGLNISLPFLNGGLYKARHAEAEIRAQALDRRITDVENRIVRDVNTAWLSVNTAAERIRLTQQFVEQASQALELAQTRYDLGLSSIVELSQAQLAKTNADLQYATAKYDYQLRRSVLEYQTGGL